MIIAIDFDGTIVDDAGIEMPGAIEVIKRIQEKNTTILWTCRGGELLDQAVEWLKERGIVFDQVNENVHALTSRGGEYWPRKVFAHYYIDDRIIGYEVDWNLICMKLVYKGLI